MASPEGELYSRHEERAQALERKVEGTQEFIDSMETLIGEQRTRLSELQVAEDIPDDERAERIAGIGQTIEVIIERIEEEEVKNIGRLEQIDRLRRLHEMGKTLLGSIPTIGRGH